MSNKIKIKSSGGQCEIHISNGCKIESKAKNIDYKAITATMTFSVIIPDPNDPKSKVKITTALRTNSNIEHNIGIDSRRSWELKLKSASLYTSCWFFDCLSEKKWSMRLMIQSNIIINSVFLNFEIILLFTSV